VKGLILGHKKNGVQVMDKNGFFHFVRGFTDSPVGSEIEIPEEAEEGSKYTRPFGFRQMVLVGFAAACICVICFLVGRWSGGSNEVAYYIEFDGIADFELAFNDRGVVVSAGPLFGEGAGAEAGEGAEALDFGQFEGHGHEAIGMALQLSKEDPHIAYRNGPDARRNGETKFVEVTVIARDDDQALSIRIDIGQYLYDPEGEVEIDAEYCGWAKRDAAMEMGVSAGKLVLAEQVRECELHPGMSLEDIAALPIGELYEEIHSVRVAAAA